MARRRVHALAHRPGERDRDRQLDLTRSIAAENSPYYRSGAKPTWSAHPEWEVAAVYLNGWQRIRRVQNDTPCLGTQLVWRPKDGLSLNWSTFAGSDVPDSLGLFRAFSNLFGTWTRGAWGVQTGVDVGVQEARGAGPLEAWWTPLLIVRRQVGDRVRLVARAEHYADTGPGDPLHRPSANFVVIADLRSRGSGPFEAAISKLGESYRLNPLVWLLHTDRTAGTIRNELIQHLGHSDHLVIVDATRGKTAWFNLGPEADAKIRKVWKRPADKGNS